MMKDILDFNSTGQVRERVQEYMNAEMRKQQEQVAVGLRPDGLASPVSYRFDLIPPDALMKIAEVMEEGVRTGHKDNGWRKMDVADLLNHAIGHIVKYMQGVQDGEDHLANAMVRMMMVWENNRTGTAEQYKKRLQKGEAAAKAEYAAEVGALNTPFGSTVIPDPSPRVPRFDPKEKNR